MTINEELLVKWAEFRDAVTEADDDILKLGSKRNAAAGLRARKLVRIARKLATDIIKLSLTINKEIAEERQIKNSI